MSDPTTPDLSQSRVQRIVEDVKAKLVEANPALGKASDDRLEQKAKDNLYAAVFIIPGLIVILGWLAVLVWRDKPLSGWNLSPVAFGFVMLIIGAVNGDKDVLTRLQGLMPVLQGFVNLVLSFIPGRTPPPPPTPPAS